MWRSCRPNGTGGRDGTLPLEGARGRIARLADGDWGPGLEKNPGLWADGAVGVIGAADNDANLLYGGVLAVGLVGALIARFRPHGMAWALLATAVAQALVAGTAMVAGFGAPASGPAELLFLNGFFVALWVGSAWLFWTAAGGKDERPTAQSSATPG